MKSTVLFGVFLLLSIFIFFTVSPVSAASKSFYFPNVTIDVRINSDGSFNLRELRTFYFTGSFSEVYWDIPVRDGESIENITVAENDNGNITPYNLLSYADETRPANNYAVERQGHLVHIEAYHSSYNQSKTFVLSYLVRGGIKKYQDVGDFYWKVIGDKWGARTDVATVNVYLPSAVDRSQIYVWGHGPLNGQASIVDGATARFIVHNILSNTYALC